MTDSRERCAKKCICDDVVRHDVLVSETALLHHTLDLHPVQGFAENLKASSRDEGVIKNNFLNRWVPTLIGLKWNV